MRNSVRMHSAKSSAEPRRICASAILRLVGDFVRIKATAADANAASAPPAAPAAPAASSAARISSTCSPVNSVSIAVRWDTTGPWAADRATQCLDQVRKLRRGDPMGGDARSYGIRGIEPLAGERAIDAEGCRQARQEEGRPDVGKEAD